MLSVNPKRGNPSVSFGVSHTYLKFNAAIDSVVSLCYLFNFILDAFLTGALHVDIVAVRTGIVAGNCLGRKDSLITETY